MSGEKTLCQRYCEDSIADGPSVLARWWGFRDETQLRKRCAPHRIASGGFFGQNRKLKRSRKTDLGVERSRNPDLGKKNPDLGAAMPGRRGLCRAAGASQPLAKKSVLQSSPHGTTGIFFLGKIPTLARAWQAAGYAGQARPGRLLCRAGAAGWRSAKPYDRMIRMIRMTRRAGVSGKNMFIRHVEIKRFWWLGAAEMRTRVALVWHLC